MRAEPILTCSSELRAVAANVTYMAQSSSNLQIYKQAQPTM